MILDSLKNSALYYGVSPRMKQAFELIASTDWTTMEPGIHELDGKDIYVNVMERELKQKPDAKLEIHNEYIDIQVLIRGEEESFGWSERRELKKPLGEFSVENDIQLFDDVPQTYYTMYLKIESVNLYRYIKVHIIQHNRKACHGETTADQSIYIL